MAVPKSALLLSSFALTLFSFRYAPQFAIFPGSYAKNITTLFLIQLFAQLIWQALVYPHFFSPLRHLPQAPGGDFFWGHFWPILKEPTGEPHREWIDNVPNDGVIIYRHLFNAPRVFVTSPKALAEVLVHRSYEFIKPSRLRTGLGRLLGVGVLIAEGDEHKRQRKHMMPAFSFRHIKDLYPIFWNKSKEMADTVSKDIKDSSEDSAVVEIRELASRATLDIIGLAGCGQDFDSLADPENELYKTYNSIFSQSRNPAAQFVQIMLNLLPPWLVVALPLKENDTIGKAVHVIKSTARNLIAEKRSKLEKGQAQVDILSVAMESGGFTDEDLVNQLMTFLAAGHETTASALSWAIYLLCKYPDVQTKLREEIRAELDLNGEITAAQLDSLPYLNAVLNETMRIFPPVPITLREASHDTKIQGHFIPAGTTVIISPWAINTSKALWGDDARDFKPERWLGPGRANTGGADSNYAVTTFLHGPRSCIGQSFAKAEFACLVAALVGRFEIGWDGEEWPLAIQGGITARPKGGLNVRMREVDAKGADQQAAA